MIQNGHTIFQSRSTPPSSNTISDTRASWAVNSDYRGSSRLPLEPPNIRSIIFSTLFCKIGFSRLAVHSSISTISASTRFICASFILLLRIYQNFCSHALESSCWVLVKGFTAILPQSTLIFIDVFLLSLIFIGIDLYRCYCSYLYFITIYISIGYLTTEIKCERSWVNMTFS